MSSEIKSTKGRNQTTRSPEQIIMLPKSLRAVINNPITKTKKQTTNKTLRKKIMTGKTKEAKVKGRIPCGVCSETTHGNLLGCPEFQKYSPG